MPAGVTRKNNLLLFEEPYSKCINVLKEKEFLEYNLKDPPATNIEENRLLHKKTALHLNNLIFLF